MSSKYKFCDIFTIFIDYCKIHNLDRSKNRNKRRKLHNQYLRTGISADFNDPYALINETIQNMTNLTNMSTVQQIPETLFTVHCGEIRPKDEGCRVKIAGKVSKRPNTHRFLEIKDVRGSTQLVANDDRPEIQLKFQSIPNEAYISVIGTVQVRQERFINRTVPTGACEIGVEEIERIVLPITATNTSINSSPFDQQNRQYSTNSNTRGITSIEYKKSASENILKYFINRRTTCGELRKEDAGRSVVLVGWLDSKKHAKFLQLKDGYGITQIVIDNEDHVMKQTAATANEDSIILVRGTVITRPQATIRHNSETGQIEVLVVEMKILNPKEEYISPYDDDIDDNQSIEKMQVDTTQTMPQEVPRGVVEKPKVNLYTYRTHNCGELNESNIGQEVTLTGWLEFHRMKKFFTLRDGYGCTQVIIPEELCALYNIEEIPYESILKVTGLVLARPVGMRNETMATGSIEVNMKSLNVLNEAKKNLPIEIRNFNRAKENLRLEYRYLDLRFSDMQKNLRTRSKVLMKMREYLINHCAFVEVETPTLFRRTPGGAQEFVVPSRKPGKFYSLVQSPQQFKQMLMIGAIDRYFQIARCYRDETTRPDRQPEFTQLDIELSFTDREKIMALVEGILVHCWPEVNGALSTPFQKMTYDEAMEKYGSDKPDLRFDMQLQNVTNLVALNEEISKNNPNMGAYALVLKHPQSNISNSVKNELKEMEKDVSGAKLVISKLAVDSVMDWTNGPLKNLLTNIVLIALAADLHLEPNDLLILGYGKKSESQTLMGRIRNRLHQDLEERGLVPELAKEENKFLWVLDFPLFTPNDETKVLESTHHPFTAPHPDDVNLLKSLSSRHLARSLAYDLVLNGQEIGGGSIRIHNPNLQQFILDDILKLERKHLNHMIEALKSGAPPHGGIALGIDRLISIICNTPSIRDVIAFPKSAEGRDPLSKAPTEISEEEKKIYHIKVVDDEEMTTN